VTAGPYVVDASVAIKWLVDEPGSDAALALRGAELAAPGLLRIEAGNVLRTLAARGAISIAVARELFAFLQTAPVVIVDHDDHLEGRALALALEIGHPIYDCVYLALAERMSRTLVTADARFLRSVAGSSHAAIAVPLDAAAGDR
jgi:predicted nucleic acid-binding protein